MFWSQTGITQHRDVHSLCLIQPKFLIFKNITSIFITAQLFCTEGGFPAQLNIMEKNIRIVVGPAAASPGYLLDSPSLCETLSVGPPWGLPRSSLLLCLWRRSARTKGGSSNSWLASSSSDTSISECSFSMEGPWKVSGAATRTHSSQSWV